MARHVARLTGVMTNCPGIARMIFRIQSNILVTCDRAMYSASVELRATDGCSTLPKTIRLPLRKIKYPVRERRDPFHCAQSESNNKCGITIGVAKIQRFGIGVRVNVGCGITISCD